MPSFSQRLTAVDVHAEGEPGRVITDGMPDLPPGTMLEKMRWLEANADHLRLQMLREPRGYPGLCCNAIVASDDPRADAGFIIMEQTEYPPMSGSNTICVVTTLIETGMVASREPVTELTLESPAGLIKVEAEVRDGKVKNVTFENVPAFAVHLDRTIEAVMTRDRLVTAPVGTTLDEAEQILHEHRIEKLPVVDGEGRLRGLITVKDIFKRRRHPNACKDAHGRLRVAGAVGASHADLDRCAALVGHHGQFDRGLAELRGYAARRQSAADVRTMA